MEDIEIAVVGAGPAGLSAALYAARFCRRTSVLHNGTSRASRIPRTYNVSGFQNGIAGPELLDRMREHAEEFGANLISANIVSAVVGQSGFRLNDDQGQSWTARAVILATGLELNEIPIDRDVHEAAIAHSVLRYCPICDGYEHRDKRIAVVGFSTTGAAEALFLRTFSDQVTLLPKENAELTAQQRRELAQAGISVIPNPVSHYAPDDTGMTIWLQGGAPPLRFDIVYPALGCQPRNQIAMELGLDINEDGKVSARAPLGTNVPGLFCAGDIVEGLDQISVAIGHGAVAATRAHNWLRERDGETIQAVLSSGTNPAAAG